jgi:hypothetical protein
MVLTALAVCGCSRDVAQPAAGPPPSISETDGSGPSVPTPTDPGPLPPPEALSDVVVRLADPAVPGTDKLPLVENSTGADAAALDTFAAALRDNGFTPVTVRASDIVSSRPGDVVATIAVTGPDSEAGAGTAGFSFPMEFRRVANGWQLTRQTAEMLLAFGNARADAPRPPASSPAPPR